MGRSSLPAGSLAHQRTDGKFVEAMSTSGLGDHFRGPGEDEISPQNWYLIWFDIFTCSLCSTYFHKSVGDTSLLWGLR